VSSSSVDSCPFTGISGHTYTLPCEPADDRPAPCTAISVPEVPAAARRQGRSRKGSPVRSPDKMRRPFMAAFLYRVGRLAFRRRWFVALTWVGARQGRRPRSIRSAPTSLCQLLLAPSRVLADGAAGSAPAWSGRAARKPGSRLVAGRLPRRAAAPGGQRRARLPVVHPPPPPDPRPGCSGIRPRHPRARTSATCARPATRGPSRPGSGGSPTPASPTCRSGCCRSATAGTNWSPPSTGPGTCSPGSRRT
jgi:hypothetical protein